MSDSNQIAVIGGGAAGFFTAINIKEINPSLKVVIYEKTNQVLTKVKVSGGGRCNVTHACFDPTELINYYPRGKKELRGPFHQFMTFDTIEWFANHGIELKTEDDGRMFPVSNESQEVIDCFLSLCKKYGIQIALKKEVVAVSKSADQFLLNFKDGSSKLADKMIIASGGNAKLAAYDWISKLGHSIIPPIPSLFTFNLPKHSITELMGLSVDNVTVSLENSSFETDGPLLITHWGMSGPAILKLSSMAANELNRRNYQFDFKVNWLFEHDLDSAKELIETYKAQHPKRTILKHKCANIPTRLWEYLVKESIGNSAINYADISNKSLTQLANNLVAQAFKANGKTTFKEEFVSCGGVDNKFIDFKTMESKVVPNLYFAGEVLNIDAVTGGFNFQSAWTTSFIAASSIAG